MVLLYLLNTLGPVFAIIALGWGLRRSDFLSRELFHGLNRLSYWIALPALLFYKIAEAPPGMAGSGRLLTVLIAGMIACVALGYLAAWALRLPGPRMSAFVQGSFRGNLAFIGLPIILYSFAGWNGGQGSGSETLAILALAPMVPLYNVVAVCVLLAGAHRRPGGGVAIVMKGLVTNPLILSCVAGLAYGALGLKLPTGIHRTLQSIGEMALPMALLSIGGSLARVHLGGHVGFVAGASFIKLVWAPLVGLGVARVVGLTPDETLIAMIYLACPTAVSSYIMAEQMGADETLAASIVALSSALSVVALAVVMGMFH